jgi:rRNA-processing protein FCF1
MPHQNDIFSVVRTHKILLDTSFAMQPGFPEFIQTFAPVFRRNHILIPALVLWELKEKYREHTSCPIARSTLELLALLILSRQAEVRRERCDRFQDLVILRVTLQHMLAHDIVVLTNDCKLMLDLRALWNCKSVRSRQHLEVLKIHATTQRPCVFDEWACHTERHPTSTMCAED